MDPKRLRFSDLSSDSDNSSINRPAPRSRSSSASSIDLVLRLSASFSTISSTSLPSTNEIPPEQSLTDFQLPALPVTDAPPSTNSANPSRQSFVTTTSGTSVWTVQGSTNSTRLTTGVGRKESTTGTISSTEKTEKLDEALKMRRRTVATVSSNNSSEKRSITPTQGSNSKTNLEKTRTMAIADDTEELPPTQPKGPLKEVVAYVEVHSGADNRSAIIGNVLRDLGAVVCQRFISKVTHVVFREGRQSTLERARSRNVNLVSVLWVDVCQRENVQAPESDYGITQRQKQTPFTGGRTRRLRSMQPKPNEVELALTDDCIRKSKQRRDAQRLKREVIKDIREGRIVGMTSAAAESGTKSNGQTPAIVENQFRAPWSMANAGGWNSMDEDETPNSLLKQVADVRKKTLGITDTPSSQSQSNSTADDNETLADSVRKRLFNVGGLLHGSPVPSFLNRPKTHGKTKRSKSTSETTDNNKTTQDQSRYDLRDRNSLEKSGVEANFEKSPSSKIDQIVEAVCENVARMAIDKGRKTKLTKRRIFDPKNSSHLSGDVESIETGAPTSLTERVAAENGSLDVDDIFGHSSIDENRRTGARRGEEDGDQVRIRSSIFRVDSSFDAVRQLQKRRRSSDELHGTKAIGKAKKTGKNATRKATPTNKVTVYKNNDAGKSKTARLRRGTMQSLVMTNLKQEDRELVPAIVKRLKGFRISKKVTIDTTHVICGDNRRTLSVLMGVARGCWILPLDWVYHSLVNGSWLDEERFELADLFPGAKAVRKRKNTASLGYGVATSTIFNTVGPFYVSPLSQPPSTDLSALIRWCGGKVVLTSRRASITIGCVPTHEEAIGVKETWILDSIMQQRTISMDDYIINAE